MKYIFFCMLICLLLASCSPRRTETTDDSMKYTDALSTACIEARDNYLKKQYSEAQLILEKALGNLPTSLTPNDSLLKYVRETLSEYRGVMVNAQKYQEGEQFLRSIQSPLIQHDSRYELLATRAHLLQMGRESKQAIALIDSFAAIPDPTDAQRLIKYCELASGVYFYSGHDIKNAIRLLEKATNSYRQGNNSPYIGRIYSRLGSYYRQENDYQHSAEANQAAIDFHENDSIQRQKNGIIMAYGEQSNLYLALKMYDRALVLNQLACNHSLQQDSFGLGDLYRFRSEIFKEKKQTDSTIYYLNKAYETSLALGRLNGVFYNRVALAQFYLTIPDSAKRSLEISRTLCTDSAKVPKFLRLNLKQYIGEGLIQTGETVRGIRLMEEAAKEYQEIGMKNMQNQMIPVLMKAYLKGGMNEQFIKNYPYYQSVVDSMHNDDQMRTLAATTIQYETQKKEKENQLLNAEIRLKNNALKTYTLTGLSLLLCFACAGGWLVMRQRSLKLHLHLQEQEKRFADQKLHEQSERLKQLIASRQELNNHNEDLLRQLAEVQVAHEKTCNLDRVMESLQPRLLTNEEEEQFRTAFSSLYPTVLLKLRSICPRATRTDELLCMLIILKQTNEEISRTLGISRASVLQNRYRLRSKLDLPERSDLDTEVRRLLMNR